jgi:hypothetical protein
VRANFIEKRRHPRVAKTLPLKIADAKATFITETKNISRSGAYCQVRKIIPPLTKLGITLFVPNVESKNSQSQKIKCEGVVVRSEPVVQDGNIKYYNIAIFFNRIREADAQVIERYVNWYLRGQKN